jgi:uncharacterized protein YaaR (DUF327 family)
MKISDIKNLSQPVSKMNMEGVAKRDLSSATFRDVLAKTDADDLDRQLYLLLEDIDKTGQRLAERSCIKDLLEYKRLVGQFLNKILDNAFKKSTTTHFDKRGRQRIYSIIKRVSSRLDDLTREMLNKEKGALNLLERIGEIRGLLLDLFV